MEVKSKVSVKSLALRVFRAGIKAFVVYIAYFIFLQLTEPIYQLIGQYNQLIDLFFIAMLVFTFAIEFLSGTIFQYMLSFSKEFFLIFYFVTALNGGIIKTNIENIELVLNLQIFLLILILISVIGLARTVLDAINFLNKKSERKMLENLT